MLIHFDSAFSEDPNRASEYYESVDRPLLVVNKKFVLIAINKKASMLFPGLSVGTGVRLRFGRNARRVSELLPRQVLCAELSLFGTSFAATVIGGGEKLLVLFDSVEARIEKTVFDACGRMSGYDLKLRYPSQISGGETPVLTRGMFGDDAEFLFRVLNERKNARELSPFNAAEVLSAVIEKSGGENFTVTAKNADVNTVGSMRDLAVAAAYMLSFFKRNQSGEKAEIRTFSDSLSLSFCVEGATDISEDEAGLLLSGRPVGTGLSDKAAEESFWLYLIRLLAETNLWSLETEYKNGRARFTLILPSAEQNAHCVLRDRPDALAAAAVKLFEKKQ